MTKTAAVMTHRCKFCDAPIALSPSGLAWLDTTDTAECRNNTTWHGRRAKIDAEHEPVIVQVVK